MIISYKGKLYEIETNDEKLKINGDLHSLKIDSYNDNIFKISIDGIQKIVYVASDDKNAYIFIDGEQYSFQKADEESSLKDRGNDFDKDIEYIKPPMPGSVVKLLVEKGQKVEEGVPIIVVEAMKMEITLYSSITGIVTDVNVQAGEQVDADKVLAVIKRNENV